MGFLMILTKKNALWNYSLKILCALVRYLAMHLWKRLLFHRGHVLLRLSQIGYRLRKAVEDDNKELGLVLQASKIGELTAG